MTTILLIRHGQNDFVEKGKLAGWLPGVHLNETGRAQAARIAEALEEFELEAVYSSPLERAFETAKPIARAQGLAVRRRKGLGEIDIGSWEGLSLRAARRRKLWPIIQNTPSLARFPDGESFFEAQGRVVSTLEELRGRHRGTIACVSHADPIKLAVAHYVGMPMDGFQKLDIGPASVTQLTVEPGSARLNRLNVILRKPPP